MWRVLGKGCDHGGQGLDKLTVVRLERLQGPRSRAKTCKIMHGHAKHIANKKQSLRHTRPAAKGKSEREHNLIKGHTIILWRYYMGMPWLKVMPGHHMKRMGGSFVGQNLQETVRHTNIPHNPA